MALAREQYATPGPILPPRAKSYLESFRFGRVGLRIARKIRGVLRNFRDPCQRKVWICQLALPLRNAVLLNRPLKVAVDGISVSLVPRGAFAGDLWIGVRRKQRAAAFVLRLLEPGMIFFDVGANAGLFAISAARKIGGRSVFAFEPCSSTLDLLKRNLALNEMTDLNVFQTALGHSPGEAVLQVNSRGRDDLNTLGRATHPDSRVVAREGVPITTVDAFMKERYIPRVDVMKVDIEGAELLLFRGARELLARADAPLIMYEGFGFLTRGFSYHPVEILWFLEASGYSLFSLNSETGHLSELKPDYQYDSMVVAAKRGHPAYARLRERLM